MAAKASIPNVVDEGFSPSQFGTPANWLTSGTGGYLDPLLTQASNWAQQRVTPTLYAAQANGYVFDCLVRAEVAYVAQRLWSRRKGYLDSNAQIGMGDDKRQALIQQCITNASDSECTANFWIAEAQRTLGIDPTADMGGTGISTGYTETGQFPQTSDQPLNVEA